MPAPGSRRPTGGRSLDRVDPRALLAAILPYPGRFRAALAAACARPAVRRRSSGAFPAWRASRAMLALAPATAAAALGRRPARRVPGGGRAAGPGGAAPRLRPVGARSRHQRGGDPPPHAAAASRSCSPRARAAAARWSITWADAEQSHAAARSNIDAWIARDRRRGARRDRRHHVGLRHDDQGLRLHVPQRSGLCREGGAGLGARQGHHRISRDARPRRAGERRRRSTVAYHAACSLQHGQQVKTAPKALLARAGFEVREPAEGHLCCGSAGTYNMLQPEISARLRDRKVDQHRGDRRRRRSPPAISAA